MTGNTDRSWNSTDRFVGPALLACIEAAWVTTWIGALASTKAGVRFDVPFLALAVLASLTVGLSSLVVTKVASSRWKGPALALVIVLLASLGAGSLGSMYLHGSFLALSLHPWSIASGQAGTAAGIAWFASSLAVLRGTWLGSSELGSKQVVASLGIASAAFAVFFIAEALHHGDALMRSELDTAIVLLLLAFPIALALVAVVNERDLERSIERRSITRARFAWFLAIVVPMIAVALLAALIVVIAGPGLPFIARLARDVARWVVAVIDDIVTWIASWVHLSAKAPNRPTQGSGGVFRERVPHGGAPLWIAIVASVLAAMVLLGLLVLCFKMLRQLIRGRQRRVKPPTVEATEERDSVFSWGHLLDQIRALLARWRGGLPVVAEASNSSESGLEPDLGARSVRRLYLRVLMAARAAGVGRRDFETPDELRVRLSALSPDLEADRLSSLTTIYERARYGEQLETTDELDRAGEDARLLVEALGTAGEPVTPDAVTRS